MLVESIMIRDVVTCSPGDTLQQAKLISRNHRIRHLPVVEAGRVVGLISDRDLRDAAPSTLETEDRRQIMLNTRVETIMVRDVHSCHPLDFVEDAALLMYRHHIGCLPVCSGGQLLGIISERDILHTLVEMMGVHAQTSRVEVEVPDRPGVLADVSDLLRARRISASTVLVFPSKKEGFKTLVFRLRTMDPRRFIHDIETLGFSVVRHPSALDELGGEE